jgi:hypothetical protein
MWFRSDDDKAAPKQRVRRACDNAGSRPPPACILASKQPHTHARMHARSLAHTGRACVRANSRTRPACIAAARACGGHGSERRPCETSSQPERWRRRATTMLRIESTRMRSSCAPRSQVPGRPPWRGACRVRASPTG